MYTKLMVVIVTVVVIVTDWSVELTEVRWRRNHNKITRRRKTARYNCTFSLHHTSASAHVLSDCLKIVHVTSAHLASTVDPNEDNDNTRRTIHDCKWATTELPYLVRIFHAFQIITFRLLSSKSPKIMPDLSWHQLL